MQATDLRAAERSGGMCWSVRAPSRLLRRMHLAAGQQRLAKHSSRPHSRAAVAAAPSSMLQPKSATGWDAFEDDDSDLDELLETLEGRVHPAGTGASTLEKQPGLPWATDWAQAKEQQQTYGNRAQRAAQQPAAGPHGATAAGQHGTGLGSGLTGRPQLNRPAHASTTAAAAAAAAAAATAAANVLRDMHAVAVSTRAGASQHERPTMPSVAPSHPPPMQPSGMVLPIRQVAAQPGHAPLFRSSDASRQVYQDVSVQVTFPSAQSTAAAASSSVNGDSVAASGVVPLETFNHLFKKPYRYPATLLQRLAQSVQAPTPVQQYAIPIIQSGRDLLAVAPSGTGKTSAYLIPLIGMLSKANRYKLPKNCCYPTSLVLAPSRELVQQVHAEARRMIHKTHLKAVAVMGGETITEQVLAMRGGADLLVATPGRLSELVSGGRVRLDNVRTVVVDEADHMCDTRTFAPDLAKILGDARLPTWPERQTILVSSALTEDLQSLVASTLKEHAHLHARISAASMQLIEQQVELLPSHEQRLERVAHHVLTSNPSDGSVLVLTNSVATAKKVHAHLASGGHPVGLLHGDLPQMLRDEATTCFRYGVTSILVCTGMVARGVDMPGTTLVINCEVPAEEAEYLQRIGRTGRAGRPGAAVTLFTPADGPRASGVAQALRASGQTVPAWLEKMESGSAAAFARGAAARPAHGNSEAEPRQWQGSHGEATSAEAVLLSDAAKRAMVDRWQAVLGDAWAQWPAEQRVGHKRGPKQGAAIDGQEADRVVAQEQALVTAAGAQAPAAADPALASTQYKGGRGSQQQQRQKQGLPGSRRSAASTKGTNATKQDAAATNRLPDSQHQDKRKSQGERQVATKGRTVTPSRQSSLFSLFAEDGEAGEAVEGQKP